MNIIEELIGYQTVNEDGALTRKIAPNAVAANLTYGVAGAVLESKVPKVRDTIASMFNLTVI